MKKLTIALCLTIMFSCINAGSAFAVKKIKVAVTSPPGSHTTIAAEEFKQYVEEKSNGKYQVDLITSFGGADTIFQSIQFDTLQMTFESTSNLSQFAPELSMFDMPYLMSTPAAVNEMVYGDTGKKLLAYLDKKGVRSLGYFYAGPRYIISPKKLETAADLQGLKHRTNASRIYNETIRALGFAPVPIASPELITSLQQGVVDSADVEINYHLTSRACDVAPYILDTGHLAVVYLAYISNTWYESLPKDDKVLFDDAFAFFMKRGNELAFNSIQESLDILTTKENNVYTKISDADKEKLMKQSLSAFDALPDNLKYLGSEIAETLRNVK